MKTIEEKAKAYDEAIERYKAKQEYESQKVHEFIEYLFPELKENEDERIRKGLIALLKFGLEDNSAIAPGFNETKEQALAWLEKQKSIDVLDEEERKFADNVDSYRKEIDEAYQKGYNEGVKVTLEKHGTQNSTLPKWKYKNDNIPLLRDSLILNKYGCVAKSPSGAIVSDIWVLDFDELTKLPKEEFEKQDEQKPIDPDILIQQRVDALADIVTEQNPADKIEPKFNFSVGQWIVATGKCVYLITKIDGFNVTLVDVDGNEYVFDTSSLEDAHLWTIQDAKDGDVLFHSDSASNGIFIFKEIIDKGFAKKIICYCDYDSEDHFCLGEHHTCCWADAKILHPATKEQRDTLEKAMTDAGYTFDFEKKELKKIEQGNSPLLSNSSNVGKDELNPCSNSWSEEDELTRTTLINLVEMYYGGCFNKTEKNRLLDWLKSLKDRLS